MIETNQEEKVQIPYRVKVEVVRPTDVDRKWKKNPALTISKNKPNNIYLNCKCTITGMLSGKYGEEAGDKGLLGEQFYECLGACTVTGRFQRTKSQYGRSYNEWYDRNPDLPDLWEPNKWVRRGRNVVRLIIKNRIDPNKPIPDGLSDMERVHGMSIWSTLKFTSDGAFENISFGRILDPTPFLRADLIELEVEEETGGEQEPTPQGEPTSQLVGMSKAAQELGDVYEFDDGVPF